VEKFHFIFYIFLQRWLCLKTGSRLGTWCQIKFPGCTTETEKENGEDRKRGKLEKKKRRVYNYMAMTEWQLQ